MGRIDRIAEPWGTRTPYGPGETWPTRVDSYLAGGRTEADVDRWVQSASILHSNGDALDIAVKDGRIVGVRGREVDRLAPPAGGGARKPGEDRLGDDSRVPAHVTADVRVGRRRCDVGLEDAAPRCEEVAEPHRERNRDAVGRQWRGARRDRVGLKLGIEF